jgi:molybdopterin converting factor small subunit
MNMDNGTSLKTAVGQIAARSAALKRILTVAGLNEHSSSLLILVNEKDSSVLNGLETPLQDGDEVVLIPVIHGG